jgi:hypothetical protein
MVDMKYRLTLQDVIRNGILNGYGVGKAGHNLTANISQENKSTGKVNVEQPGFNISDAEENLYFDLVDSQNFLFNPLAKIGLKDSTWVIECMRQEKEVVEKKYKLDLKSVNSEVPEFMKDASEGKGKESEKIFNLVTLYECWDIVKRKRYILIDGYTENVLEFSWPYGLKGYPYVVMVFNRAPNEPYGISDVSLYRTQQEELNILRSNVAEHTKRNNCKFYADPDMVDAKEIPKFLDNETGVVIQAKRDGIGPIQPYQIPSDMYQHDARIKEDVKEILRVSDTMQGKSGGQKKTARQQWSEDFFSGLGISERQATVNEYVLESADVLFEIMQNEYTLAKMVEIAGPDGKYIAKSATKADFAGDYYKMVQQGTGAQNKPQMATMIEQGLKLTMGNPLISPLEWTEIAVDVFFEGVDTSKLIIPNAEQMTTDPIYREQWRQIMLTIASQSMLKNASAAIQGSGQGQGGKVPATPSPAQGAPPTAPPGGMQV